MSTVQEHDHDDNTEATEGMDIEGVVASTEAPSPSLPTVPRSNAAMFQYRTPMPSTLQQGSEPIVSSASTTSVINLVGSGQSHPQLHNTGQSKGEAVEMEMEGLHSHRRIGRKPNQVREYFDVVQSLPDKHDIVVCKLCRENGVPNEELTRISARVRNLKSHLRRCPFYKGPSEAIQSVSSNKRPSSGSEMGTGMPFPSNQYFGQKKMRFDEELEHLESPYQHTVSLSQRPVAPQLHQMQTSLNLQALQPSPTSGQGQLQRRSRRDVQLEEDVNSRTLSLSYSLHDPHRRTVNSDIRAVILYTFANSRRDERERTSSVSTRSADEALQHKLLNEAKEAIYSCLTEKHSLRKENIAFVEIPVTSFSFQEAESIVPYFARKLITSWESKACSIDVIICTGILIQSPNIGSNESLTTSLQNIYSSNPVNVNMGLNLTMNPSRQDQQRMHSALQERLDRMSRDTETPVISAFCSIPSTTAAQLSLAQGMPIQTIGLTISTPQIQQSSQQRLQYNIDLNYFIMICDQAVNVALLDYELERDENMIIPT